MLFMNQKYLIHIQRLKYKQTQIVNVSSEQTVNELCSDDPHHTKVQCALARHMLENLYATVLLYCCRNVCGLCSVFSLYEYVDDQYVQSQM